MINRHKKIRKKNVFTGILKIILFIVLAFGAIRVGMLGGDKLSESKVDVVKNVDTEILKVALNYSLPIIDMVYNSGHISMSLSGEIKKLVKGVFNFDLDAPLTILNAQSPLLYSYYYNSYQPQLAMGDTQNEPDAGVDGNNVASRSGDSDVRNEMRSEVRQDAKVDDEKPETTPESTKTPEPADPGKKKDPEESGGQEVTTSGKVLVQQIEGTNYKIDIDALLKEPLKLNFGKSGPKALIYHTHTTEGYLKNINELNRKDVPERTTDERYNVVKVGDELAKWLKQYGIGTIHNGTNHLEKGDTGAYGRSLNTITSIMNGNPSIKLVFDIHRDGLGDGKKLRAVTKVNGKNAAQVMFVVGTNKNLEHPNWKENLKLALKLQKYLEDNYPGITKPVYISENRYNEHVSNGALIIEVGGDGNTIDESVESMKYVAKAISEVIK